MPAAVATGVQINGPLKNKKIVFDDAGEAVAKPNKKERPQKPKKQHQAQQRNGQAKKPQRITFDDDGDGEVEERKPWQKNHQKEHGHGFQGGKKPQKIKFGDDGEVEEQQPWKKNHQKENGFEKAKKPQKIKFGDDGEAADKTKKPQRIKFDEDGAEKEASDSEEDSEGELEKQASFMKRSKHQSQADEEEESQKKWYQVHPDYPSSEEVLDMKDNEQLELFNLCKNAFETDKTTFNRRNPSDVRWLQTALHKGTAKDRANSGALLVTSNPLGNLEALSNLISFCKISNKASNDVIAVLTDLWQEVLLPPNRKLLSIHTRGADWKKLRKDDTLREQQQRRIYSAQRHPNMCGVIVAEAEKLLFRNNISERAQHFALCFLSSIAPSGRPEVCTKLVNICFALFKVLVQKGAVNNRTMQAILRCLQKAIAEAQPAKGSDGELLNKEMQDTIYRLVHLADIRVSVQTLGLLLQLVTVKTEKSDRFYNALYVKLLDLNLINVGGKTAAQLLHIVHRAIHIDSHVARAQAFVKRLLQVTLYAPPQIAAGCLIVLHKLLRMRQELIGGIGATDEVSSLKTVLPEDGDLDRFGSDAEDEVKEEADELQPEVKTEAVKSKVVNIDSCKYDPYHRVPAFAGAAYTLRHELLLLRQHYHPTVQVFAEQILEQKRIDYYGDPLRDFGLPHFLERFAFKNPKKLDAPQAESAAVAHKRYMAQGGRGKPVKSLTKANCTEDEMFILNFLEHKRRQAEIVAQSKKQREVKKDEDDDGEQGDEYLKEGEVDDDEFEAYLDGYFGKKFKEGAAAEEDENELNFLEELGGEMQSEKSKKKDKKRKLGADKHEEDMDEIDDDWGDDNLGEEDEDDEVSGAGGDQSDDETGSIDLQPLDDDDDMSSLFAAADEFSSLMEETAKVKGQGTSNAVYNKDKSSDKQIKWEEKRRSNSKTYTGKRSSGKPAAKGGKPQKPGKKRKH
ncbi:GL12740 [Drosophila persimilis]|uniref:GL12740 n=1 Tax=Drosophila persimilis TaxID=7234 RepID=B4H7U6_DROPE|nr:GL12740 [Drosophila persimilis]